MSVVLDASAVLAYLQDESGADLVERAILENTALCGAANWSEVCQQVLDKGRSLEVVVEFLLDRQLVTVVPVSRDDAEWAAHRYVRGEGLSLADRLCLALASRLDSVVLTADRAWGEDGYIRQIR
ncbi:type II toxin-antitoxin system VapC family toxin [Candidatus Poriferisodalis sp.]|uniref:type II toxin-antitoxin system VapC family toxin n=1 Tax=Candidatus Poriferisodalis sp. TaxID=3101277 RepID=UPI003B016D49